jgi:hypothetical protein
MRFVIPDLIDPNAHPRAVRRAVGHRAAEVRQAWRDHNERIRPLLPPSLQRLQATQLHDALIQSLHIDAGHRTVQLRLLCDDTNGYFDLRLNYRDIRLTQQETSLLCLIAHQEGAEVDRDEIDVAPTDGDEGRVPGDAAAPVFIHRISWHTGVETSREAMGLNGLGEECSRIFTLHPEIEFRFGGLEIETVPRSDRKLSRTADFITVVRDPAKIEGMDSAIML